VPYLMPQTGPYPMRRMIRRRFGLGQAATTITAQQYCSSNCKSSVFIGFLQDAISSRFLPMPTQQTASTTCSGTGVSTTSAKATKVGSAVASTGATVTGALATAGAISSAIPIVGTIAAVTLGVLSGIFASHDQAEQLQSNVLCENVPAFNSMLQQIDSELAAGTATPEQASSAYANLLAQFQAALKTDPSYKTGDALWGYNQGAQAVVAARNQDLTNGVLTSGQAAPWASSATAGGAVAVASAAGIPPAMLWIGAAVLAYLLFF
jgi:hypothetical protein